MRTRVKKIDLGQSISMLANIGVIAGLIFIAYELRQNTLATELAASQGFHDASGAANRMMVENPHISLLIASDIEGEELSQAERIQLNNALHNQFRAWEMNYWQFEQGALDEELWRGYSNYVADIVASYDTAEEYWRQRPDYFTPGFNAFVEYALSERVAR
jgi:hypothetical protein